MVFIGKCIKEVKVVKIKPICDEDIADIIKWHYDKPYDCYNFPDYSVMKKQNWAIINEKINTNEFKSVFKGNILIAFFRVQKLSNYLLLSLGLKPEFCGKGNGVEILIEMIKNILSYENFIPIKLNVRTFNVRAIKCYKAIGFRISKKFTAKVFDENIDFFEMELSYEVFKNNIKTSEQCKN